MIALTHSQAAAQGDLGSVAATAGRIARMDAARALRASEKGLVDVACKAILSVRLDPEVVLQVLDTLIAAMESDPRYQVESNHYPVKVAVMEASCTVDEEVNPPVPDEAEARAEAEADAADSRRDRERDEVGA